MYIRAFRFGWLPAVVAAAVWFGGARRAGAEEQTRFSRDTIIAEFNRQLAARKINLGAVSAFAGKALSEIAIEGPAIGADGSIDGTVSIGNAQAKAFLHYLPSEDSKIGNWMLCVRVPGKSLGDVVPGNPFTDQFDVPAPILVFSRNDADIKKADLSAAAKTFYSQVYGAADFTLRIRRGVNILTAASFKPNSSAAGMLRKVGFAPGQMQIEGVILRDFDLAELRECKANGKLLKALGQGTSIRATLPNFTLGKLPKKFGAGSAYIEITGQPSLALGFDLTVPGEGGPDRVFNAELNLAREQGGASLSITARGQGVWDNAFGVKGFTLKDAVITLLIDTQQNIGFGLGADFSVGGRDIGVAGLIKFNMITGVPTDVLVKGSISEIGIRDIATLADRLARTAGKSIKVDAIPDVKLRNFSFSFAPHGGNSALGIESGMSLKGSLYLSQTELCSFDGMLDNTADAPVIKIIGSVHDIDVKGFKLTGASTDILLGSGGDNHFRIKGACTILAATKTVDVDLSKDRIYIKLTDKLSGVFETDFELSSASEGNPFWTVRATAKQDLIRTLETKVAAEIAAWQVKSDGDIAKAKTDVAVKQAELADVDRRLATARANAQAAYDKFLKDSKSQRDALDAAERDATAKLREANGFEQARIAAYNNRRANGNIFTKNVPCDEEVVNYSKYKAAEAEYQIKHAAYETAKALMNAFLATVKEPWIKNNLGVEAAPEVSRLVIERGTKDAAYKAAQAFLDAGRKINDGVLDASQWAAKNVGKAFTVDQIDIAGALGTTISSLSGSSVHFRIAYSWLGKPHTWQFDGNLGALDLNNLGQMLANAFRARAPLGTDGKPAGPIALPAPGSPIDVTFRNATSKSLKVYWINFQNQEQLYFTMKAGATQPQRTGAGHRWVFRYEDNGAAVRTITALQPGELAVSP